MVSLKFLDDRSQCLMVQTQVTESNEDGKGVAIESCFKNVRHVKYQVQRFLGSL